MGRWFKGQRLDEQPSLIPKIRRELAKGYLVKDVCALNGIPDDTWAYWQREAIKILNELVAGSKKEEDLTESDRVLLKFLKAVREGKSQAVTESLDIIMEAGREDWKARQWYLERTRREEYGPKLHVDLEEVPKVLGYHPSEEKEDKADG